MNIQFSNVKEVVEVEVARGGRVTGLKKYEGLRVKIVVFGESDDERVGLTSNGSGLH